MKQYQTVFFDLDHTLWDFEANARVTLEHIYHEFGLNAIGINDFPAFHTTYKAHNERLWDRYRKGFIKREELKWKRMWLTLLDFKLADEKLAKEMAAVFIDLLPKQKQLFPQTLDVLDYCKEKGYQMSLITNGFEDTQWKKIEACQIGNYFTHVVTSESSNSVKPQAEIFHYAVDLCKGCIEQSLMVGDNYEVDIVGARNVGMDQVLFDPEKLAQNHNATYVINNLVELKEIL
jgi:putative hydrolase of the HAD superfamily